MGKSSKEIKIEAPSQGGTDLFFISDTHFYHRSILKPDYSNRPFKDVEEMNEAMIRNWNAAVRPHDIICHLGDLAMAGPRSTINVIRRLNGRKILIYGNHDLKIRGLPEAEQLFERVADTLQIKVDDADAHQGVQRITLCHYAMRLWNKSHFGSWHLYGHSHGNLCEPDNMRSMDVGVDATVRRLIEPEASRWKWQPTRQVPNSQGAYRPLSYAEVKAIVGKRGFGSVDHHREDDR
jgi:calcineurin-like phosphoesterase family protein